MWLHSGDQIQSCFGSDCIRTIYIFRYEPLFLLHFGGQLGSSKYISGEIDLINLSENVHMTKNQCASTSRMIEVGSNIEYLKPAFFIGGPKI